MAEDQIHRPTCPTITPITIAAASTMPSMRQQAVVSDLERRPAYPRCPGSHGGWPYDIITMPLDNLTFKPPFTNEILRP